MVWSPLLGAYLTVSERGAGYGERTLARRLAEGREDGERLDERRGIASEPRPDGPLMWLHAASVGESVSLLEMIRRLGEERPELSFLLTTGTVTSAQVLADRMPDRVIHQFVPLDVRPWIRAFLDHWRPDLAVLVEGEIWPGLIHETGKRRIPLAMINARMTDAARRRWRFGRGAAKALLKRLSAVQAQDQASADRLVSLGLPRARLEVTGTLKEGSAALPHDEGERQRLAAALDMRPVWFAASTHDGEEALAAAAHRTARRSWHRLLLVVAPRHPDRGGAVVAALRADGWKVAQRSAGETVAAETEIYVADTIGEMGLWFRLCAVTLMGGSLVPVGGHNPFEPAALGSAILHGPHVENFADIYARLAAAGAVVEVTGDGLGRVVAETLEPDVAARLAHAAWSVCSEGAEVTEKAMDLLLALLDGVA